MDYESVVKRVVALEARLKALEFVFSNSSAPEFRIIEDDYKVTVHKITQNELFLFGPNGQLVAEYPKTEGNINGNSSNNQVDREQARSV